ncbi:MAG: hypothetical protein IKA19_04115 [Muribaculaceae bacterium]|nr:hypothetical protein [Muribaculaceae bacterium]
MEILKDILIHIIAYIIYGGGLIGVILMFIALIRFMIGPFLGEKFNPMKGWWD